MIVLPTSFYSLLNRTAWCIVQKHTPAAAKPPPPATHRGAAEDEEGHGGVVELRAQQHDEGRRDATQAGRLVLRAQHRAPHQRGEQLCGCLWWR